jgi:hypothetical protein
VAQHVDGLVLSTGGEQQVDVLPGRVGVSEERRPRVVVELIVRSVPCSEFALTEQVPLHRAQLVQPSTSAECVGSWVGANLFPHLLASARPPSVPPETDEALSRMGIARRSHH